MKVLLIDDSSTKRLIQRKTLKSIGITRIVEGKDGSEAIPLLQLNPDTKLILLDWNMPKANGLTALQAIKSHQQFRNIPVIMVTIESESTKIVQALKAGAGNYIVMPYEPQTLIQKIVMATQSPSK